MGVIAFLNAHSLFESYLFYNDLTWPGLGSSYLHYHLTGLLFLTYSHFLFKIAINLKLWLGFAIGFTVVRLILLTPLEEGILETATSFTPAVIGLTVDNLLSVLLNIGLLILAFSEVSKIQFMVNPGPQEQANYSWLRSLLFISIVLFSAIFLLNVASVFDEDWLIYFKLESVINSIFSLALIFVSLRIPVFSIHGDYQDLDAASKKKYLNSSLTKNESSQLWEEINQLMENEKPFLNPGYRLNDMASETGRSIHHISQTINEQKGTSFSEFVNQYRVREAKGLLDAGRAREVTVLAVALEAGFNSKTAFYNAFKKMTGKSPTVYLKERE